MPTVAEDQPTARRIHVRGVVQGVGFRPYVFRLALQHGLAGWVVNGDDGVRIHVEGRSERIDGFLGALSANAPPAARISAIDVVPHAPLALAVFDIRESVSTRAPTARMSPDLALCDDCLEDLFEPSDHRFLYPYVNCTNCGPRFSILRALPYDRSRTTMAEWAMCARCAAEYGDPANRRFHAQPVACPSCGPNYTLVQAQPHARTAVQPPAGIGETAQLLRRGCIVAVKGIGGYHLACDARNEQAVTALRERKFRKEKPFAVMARDLERARRLVWLTPEAEERLSCRARPIVLCPAREALKGVAPDTGDLGVMLPYAPLHHLLFEAGAPEILVMTSGNRSEEPIAYRDEDAVQRLGEIADAMLVGERPIARRVDDSVVRCGPLGPIILRRSRGYAPDVVARVASRRPILALGADLKNTVTLVVDGEACMSQHIGDLAHHDALIAFRETVDDLMAMYRVEWRDLVVAHDLHPEYQSTVFARARQAHAVVPVQHHRAHIASVLAEHGELDARVIGISFDGTGYGDDGTIWGGEIFVGSVSEGFDRVAHLHPAMLPGGDAAARCPAQAAAGFVAALDEDTGDLTSAPFNLPSRYTSARLLVAKGVRAFVTTSSGRLFDAVAALTGFTRSVSYEGQAAIWLEHRARTAPECDAYPVVFDGSVLDWRPMLRAVIDARRVGVDPAQIARAFHCGLARGVAIAAEALAETHRARDVVVSGGVFQNMLLMERVAALLRQSGLRVLANSAVPPNDGGISLGQAALVANRPGRSP